MARVVVLSFTDDEAAEQFCRDMTTIQEEGPESTQIGIIPLSMLIAAYGKVEALVAKPTQSCPHKFRNGTFKKTKVFGWYVHAATVGERPCYRPHPLAVTNFIRNMIIASGNNLLPALLDKMRSDRTTAPVDSS